MSERGGEEEWKDQRWQGNKSEEHLCENSIFSILQSKGDVSERENQNVKCEQV